jgi:hypothetical protein
VGAGKDIPGVEFHIRVEPNILHKAAEAAPGWKSPVSRNLDKTRYLGAYPGRISDRSLQNPPSILKFINFKFSSN